MWMMKNLLNYKPFVSRQNVKFRIIAQHTMISGLAATRKAANDRDKSTTDWDDVVFEIDLLKSQEINWITSLV